MAEDKSMETGGAAASQSGLLIGVKEEHDGYFMGQHNHQLSIQFKGQLRKYKFTCTGLQTVLDAIKSREKYRELKWSDDKIVIQWGTEDRENTIATHFPSSLLKDDDILILSQTPKTVEVNVDQNDGQILPKDEYSVFYIDTAGGTNTRRKSLFVNSEVKQFKYLCVYGEKNMTVQEALERDGRFAELPNFTLIDNSDPDTVIERYDTIDVLNGKKFKIELPRGVQPSDPKKPKDPGASSTKKGGRRGAASATKQQTGVRGSTPGPSGDGTRTRNIRKLQALVRRSGFKEEYVNLGEIMKKLREQFPALKELMESRFPDNYLQKALELKKENFGKIQQDFSEVHTLRKLIKMGESVCQVVVEGICTGTGFVLIDNFIMTNAHLFNKCSDGNKLKEGTTVYAVFNYEDPPPHTYYHYFKVEESYICYISDELDYAILKVQPEGETRGSSARAEQPKVPPGVPPGLLKKFWEMPEDGGACVIGHPNGEVKQMDLTCVIEPEKREQAATDNSYLYRDSPFILYPVNKSYKQGIDKIKMGGPKEKAVMTYNTFMYHGSSGAPVFDAQGRVCGLHTAGYVFGFQGDSVIEFAQSLEIIMKDLVKMLTEREAVGLLRRIREVSGKNPFLYKILKSVRGGELNTALQPVFGEPMDIN